MLEAETKYCFYMNTSKPGYIERYYSFYKLVSNHYKTVDRHQST